MRVFLPVLLAAAGVAPLHAQAIAVDQPRSPFCIVAQAVTVTVGASMSMVEGRYDLKYVPRLDSMPPADFLPFEFAVLAPKSLDDFEALADVTQIKLRIGTVSFDPSDCVPMPAGERASALVPEDTRAMLVRFQIPRPILQSRSRLHLTYFQPHYRLAGREVSAYLPVLPDFEALKNELLFSRDDFSVEFEATGSVRLRRISANERVVEDRPQDLKIHPIDRELIAVEVEPVAAPAPTKRAPAGH